MTPPIASSIQFLYTSGCSSVAVAVNALPSLVPARASAAAKVPAKTSTRNLREAVFITSRSISKQRRHVGAVRFFMTASRPTRSLLQEARVIDVSNENVAGYFLLLEMAFDTKRRVPLIQETLVDGAVRRMADGATLAHRLVLIYKRAALLRVTLEAGFVCAEERKATGFELLLNISLPA